MFNPKFKDDILYYYRSSVESFVNDTYTKLISNKLSFTIIKHYNISSFENEIGTFIWSRYQDPDTEQIKQIIASMMPSFTEDLNDYFIGFPLAEVVDKDYFIKIFTIFMNKLILNLHSLKPFK